MNDGSALRPTVSVAVHSAGVETVRYAFRGFLLESSITDFSRLLSPAIAGSSREIAGSGQVAERLKAHAWKACIRE